MRSRFRRIAMRREGWTAPALVSLAALVVRSVQGLAYAPNFITKIIQDQTGRVPHGLAYLDENNDQRPKDTGWTAPVCTRFPPEPNGYLHLGHAKAINFNFAVARMFGGVCHMRLDDTNPSKEEREYVDSILEDVTWVQSDLMESNEDVPWTGPVRKTSDYFDVIYQAAVALIQNGDAYVDSLTADEMRLYRGTLTEPGRNSPYRARTIAENLQLLHEMKAGKHADGAHVVRAKIDMAAPNINLRDPTLYRIKHEPHQETGDTWCMYPMYDFSHPIADAMENVTHSLCSLEFEDHRPFYEWTVDKLRPTGLIGDAAPQQIEFSRLNIQSTVLSKRKLIQLVREGHVLGWDDPRLPTLSGLRRRGVSPAALRLFCERVGVSKADSNIAFSVLEECVRETLDNICPRAFSVLEPLKVTITNWDNKDELEYFDVPRHPKLTDMGTRKLPFGASVHIERSDFFDAEGPEGQRRDGTPPKGFKRLLPNDKVRLRYAYVIHCDEVIRDPTTHEPIELRCTYLPDTRGGAMPDGMDRVKGIIHWVEASTAVTCTINQYDRLFKVDEPGKESGNFLLDINKDSLSVLSQAVVEPIVVEDALQTIQKVSTGSTERGRRVYHSSLTYQFERSGYFSLDKVSSDRDSIVFNRVVTLKDTWGVKKKEDNRSRGNSRASNKPAAPLEDIRRIAFRAATIMSVGAHPEADKLLVFKLDCGDVTNAGESAEPRTVVAGLAGKVDKDNLVGSRVVAVTNLKPAKMRGIESTAMLLAAWDGLEGEDKKVELLQVPEGVPNGELIEFEGIESNGPDAMLKSKGALKAWERAMAGLRSNEDGEAVYLQDNQVFRMMSSAGAIKTTSLKESVIQ